MQDTSSTIRNRRSIRRYQPKAVPTEVVTEILEEARWAPSAGNTQSTQVFVVTGRRLDAVRAALREQAESAAPPSPDITTAPTWPERLQARMTTLFKTRTEYVAAAEARNGALPADPPPNPLVVMSGLWGAPVLLVFAVDTAAPLEYGCFDAGLYMQTVALAAQARGLGGCIMTSTLRSADALHEVLPEADGYTMIAVMTLGYPDPDAAVNHFPRERVAVEEFVTLVE